MSASEEHNKKIMRLANAHPENKTRPPSEQYRKNWDSIFVKNKKQTK
jgi:hypothetical protein